MHQRQDPRRLRNEAIHQRQLIKASLQWLSQMLITPLRKLEDLEPSMHPVLAVSDR